MLLMRQGKSAFPAQCRPKRVPNTVRGSETKSQMAKIWGEGRREVSGSAPAGS